MSHKIREKKTKSCKEDEITYLTKQEGKIIRRCDFQSKLLKSPICSKQKEEEETW